MRALVIMDMQHNFDRDGEHLDVLHNICNRIYQAKRAGDKIVVIEYEQQGPTFRPIIDAIGDYPFDKYIKTNDSADKIIRSLGCSEVTLTGCNICGCIECTIDELKDCDIKIELPLMACFCGAWFYDLHQCNTISCRQRYRERHGYVCFVS